MNELVKEIGDELEKAESAVEEMLEHMAGLQALKPRVVAIGAKVKAALAGDTTAAANSATTSASDAVPVV